MRPTDQLTTDSTVGYLVSRGLVASDATATLLGGGVSNVVIAVRDAHRHLVVKQSLPQLRVAEEWFAPEGRILTEADALELASSLVPGSAPALVDRDPERHVIVLEHAPPGWTDWKAALLAGLVDPRVARRLGDVLGTWHSASADAANLPESFDDTQAFELLRVDPYYRTTAERAGDLGPAILAHADEMGRRRGCFVHGDLSPKNVLVGPQADATPQLWVIDHEVAHLGDPAFDLAFLLCHLTMKSVHLPAHRSALDVCAEEFTRAYASIATESTDWTYVLSHVACLLLARVRGKSPAEYLTESGRARVWRLGADLLTRPPGEIAGLHQRRDGVLA